MSKCFYYIVWWSFNIHDNAELGPEVDSKIQIIDHTTDRKMVIARKQLHELHKTLGIKIAPDAWNKDAAIQLARESSNFIQSKL